MRQEVVWIPWDSTAKTFTGGKPSPVPCVQRPNRVWTLPGKDPAVQPAIPEKLQHGVNAFMEDVIHDWYWSRGTLRYFSRVSGSPGNWVLIEYDD